MKVKTNPLDKVFSLYIRTRDGWTCRRCKKPHKNNSQGLHCAHIFSRGKHNTRWNPQNAVSLCYGDHSYLDRNPEEKYKWYVEEFGQEAFDTLKKLSNQTMKFTKEQKAELKEKFKQMTKEL